MAAANPAALAPLLANATWTQTWLEAALQAEIGGGPFLNGDIFRAMTGAAASDGSFGAYFIPPAQPGSPQAAAAAPAPPPGSIQHWRGFIYDSSQTAVVDVVQHMLQPLIAALTAAGTICARRDRVRPGAAGQYAGGGPHNKTICSLFVGLPPLTYEAVRLLWFYPAKDMPANFCATQADINYHLESPHTLTFAHLGDGTASRGDHEVTFCFPTYSAGANLRWCELLQGGAAGNPCQSQMGPMGPFPACLCTNLGCPSICAAAARPAGGPVVQPGAKQGRGGSYAAAAVGEFRLLTSSALVPPTVAYVLSAVPYPARVAPSPVFESVYFGRAHEAPLHQPGFAEVRAGPLGPYQGGQLKDAFFRGFHAGEFLNSLTWGGMPLPRVNGIHGLQQRCSGWRGKPHANRAAVCPSLLFREWHTDTERRTENHRHSAADCRTVRIHIFDAHLSSPPGTVVEGVPYMYVSAPNTINRAAEVVAYYVPACNAQAYVVKFDLGNLGVEAGVVVTPWGRGH